MKVATVADPVNRTIITQKTKMYKDTNILSISKDKASSSIKFSLSCFKSYIDNNDHAQIMQTLVCYYSRKARKQPKKDQLDRQPIVLNNFVLPCPYEIP